MRSDKLQTRSGELQIVPACRQDPARPSATLLPARAIGFALRQLAQPARVVGAIQLRRWHRSYRVGAQPHNQSRCCRWGQAPPHIKGPSPIRVLIYAATSVRVGFLFLQISCASSLIRSARNGLVTTQSTRACFCSSEPTASPQPVITAIGTLLSL